MSHFIFQIFLPTSNNYNNTVTVIQYNSTLFKSGPIQLVTNQSFRTMLNLNKTLNVEDYVISNFSMAQRSLLAQLHMDILPLNIKTGRQIVFTV